MFMEAKQQKKTDMKILVPVPATKRLPEIPENEFFGPCVIVRYVNPTVSEQFNALAFAYPDQEGRWEDAMPKEIGKSIRFHPFSNNMVVEWYEEIEAEAMFPDKDTAYNVAENASGKRIHGTMMHQEGQDYIKNFILKKLKK